VIKYVQIADKETAGPATRIMSWEFIERIAREIKANPNLVYKPEIFDVMRVVNKISIKSELRGVGTDEYKTRLIFVVSAVKTLLDRFMYQPAMDPPTAWVLMASATNGSVVALAALPSSLRLGSTTLPIQQLGISSYLSIFPNSISLFSHLC